MVRALRVTVAALAATGLLTGCGVAATTATAPQTPTDFTQSPKPSDTGTFSIWLPTAAQKWPKAVQAATDQFQQYFPNVDVSISYRTEAKQLTDFADAAFQSTPPALIAISASDAHNEVVAGAFTAVTTIENTFPGWQQWNSGIVASCTQQTNLYCVPFTGDLVLAVPAGTKSGDWADAWIRAVTSTPVQHLIMGD